MGRSWSKGILFFIAITASIFSTASAATTMRDWVRFERARSLKHLHQNYSNDEVKPGAFIASPSKTAPDYFFHWVRDAAISIEPFIEAYSKETDSEKKGVTGKWLKDYISFSLHIAEIPNRSGGRGEPKFNVDGSAFDGNWGRPQNDGPGLRAITLIPLALRLLAEGEEDFVRTYLYDSAFPTHSLIKADLEFVTRTWKLPCYDLWEEVFGNHFYTRMIQRRALRDGAYLAKKLGDTGAADFYLAQAKAISDSLGLFWREDVQLIAPTFPPGRGPEKSSQLDMAVIFAALHGDLGAGNYPFSITDDRLLLSASKLRDEFIKIYRVNSTPNMPGFLMGRYPEDTYDGDKTDKLGNPWFISTLAYAEFLRKLEKRYLAQKKIEITSRSIKFFSQLIPDESFDIGSVLTSRDEDFTLILAALKKNYESLLLRVGLHMDRQTGSMSEQINRDSGKMQGARDLTWSYAAFLSATEDWD